MKNVFRKLEWYFDFYIAYFLYNGNKRAKYNQYMEQKWGKI